MQIEYTVPSFFDGLRTDFTAEGPRVGVNKVWPAGHLQRNFNRSASSFHFWSATKIF